MNLLSIEERKQLLKDELIITVEKPVYKGGQSVGILPSTVVGVHESLGIRIEISHYRSNHKNKELVQTIFDLMFDELIK